MKVFSTVLFFLVSVNAIAGGPWVYKQGKGYFKIGQSLINADAFFGPKGSEVDFATRFRFYTSSVYGEIGVTDRLTAVVYVPFFVWAHFNTGQYEGTNIFKQSDEESGIGDSDFTLKYGLNTSGSYRMSIALTLGVPLGEPKGGREGAIQTGDGEFNQMIVFETGKGYSNGMYWASSLGYNNRTNGFTDEIRYGLEGGVTKGSITALLRFYGVKPVSQSSKGSDNDNGLFADRIEYLSFTPELIYTYKNKFGVSASAGGALYARRILAAPNFSFGGFVKF